MADSLKNKRSSTDSASQPKVSSTLKAVRILECFTPKQTALSLAQISRMLEMPKSTLLNHIRSLCEAGYLYKTSDQLYHLGFKVMSLHHAAISASGITQYAIPVMEDLLDATGETIYLASYIDGKVFYIDGLYHSRRSYFYPVSGRSQYMHCVGTGKAMLSRLPEDEVRAIIQKYGLPAMTSSTITDEEALLSNLREARKRGYATEWEEDAVANCSVAVPVLSGDGKVAGALAISGSTITLKPEKVEQYAGLLASACVSLVPYAHLFPAMLLQS